MLQRFHYFVIIWKYICSVWLRWSSEVKPCRLPICLGIQMFISGYTDGGLEQQLLHTYQYLSIYHHRWRSPHNQIQSYRYIINKRFYIWCLSSHFLLQNNQNWYNKSLFIWKEGLEIEYYSQGVESKRCVDTGYF